MNYLYFLTGAGIIALITAYSLQYTPEEATDNMRIMSYNLRYDNPDDGVNAWDNRKETVANLVLFYEPLFIGTQEGLLHQLEYLDQKLTRYDWIGVGRDDGTMSGEFSALFYDSSRVQLVEGTEQTIWLSETPSKPSKSWDAALPRIVTYGKFRDRITDQEFFVLNTHFDHIGESARLNSSKVILSTIDETVSGEPVILTGDFNATPDSEPYRVLVEDRDGMSLKDAYQISKLPHVGPDFTFEGFKVKSDNERRRIDYIFVNDRVRVNKHAVISSFRGDFYPSDHLPVIADITIAD